MDTARSLPYVEIIEQPADKSWRFRYECEQRFPTVIHGVHSTLEKKTYPSIRIIGYRGPAKIIISCVTTDQPYRPHPYNLVGRNMCKHGVYTTEVVLENMTVVFAHFGVQCVKKKNIKEALEKREELGIDPFHTGFEHKKDVTSIDLNTLRLCFQVFLEGTQKGKFDIPLEPVVTNPICDKKLVVDLSIYELSHSSASVAGGTKMILLCERVTKNNIQVRFFEKKDGQVVWEGFGYFEPNNVHKKTAIVFRTPAYTKQKVTRPVQVYVQLKRPSDGATSNSIPFQLSPSNADITTPKPITKMWRPHISTE